MLEKMECIIEALLFAAGDEVKAFDIAQVTGLQLKEVAGVMHHMMERYNKEERGIMIRRIDDAYQLCTRKEYYEDIKSYFEPRHMSYLSNPAMEALAIVAYNQPITRAQIESIRGVNCDSVITRLLDKRMIHEVGKSDAPGRPTLFGTTPEFLRALGFSSLDELPPIPADEEKEPTLPGTV